MPTLFIFALLDSTDKGVEARRILQMIVKGDRAITSPLALDEVMCTLIKGEKKHLLRVAIAGIYSIPNLDVVEVSSTAPISALNLIERYDLRPRLSASETGLRPSMAGYQETDATYSRPSIYMLR